VSSTTPEGGTVTYAYDSLPSACNGHAFALPGKLIETAFANGNYSCYQYDALGRTTAITGISGSNLLCKRFFYDGSSGATGTIPTGVTAPLNPDGRMVEAETDNCTTPITPITDEWFSYDKDGHMADMWELTPHSGLYYHSHVAAFAGNGVPLSVQLANPSLYTETYGLDGEGRLNSLISGSETIVSGTTYNAASQPTYIDIGTGTDQSDYLYDSTGRMTNWTFQVGSTGSETGALTWNPNGTLRQLLIDDGYNSGGSQTCTFGTSAVMGYDDLGRLLSDNCGSVWEQTFSYDQYDNLTKSGSSSWNPGYNSSNNQYSTGATYDSSGNLTNDSIHTYVWNPFNKVSSIDSSACSSNGECITYDALGRIVETSYDGVYTEIWYTQLGKGVYMQGSSPYYAYWPTPGGGTVEVNGNAVTSYYMHKDWLGNARLSQTIISHDVISDQAYAPYGEVYNKLATGAGVPAQMFTGDTQDIVSGIFDTPNRELNASQGRWLSPDPAGAHWNQYAYVTNPNSRIDPSGLEDCSSDSDDSEDCNGNGDNGGGDPDLPSFLDLPTNAFAPLPDSLATPSNVDAFNFAFYGGQYDLSFDSSQPLDPQAVYNEVGAMAGADENLILMIGASPYALGAAGACAVSQGCTAGAVGASLLYNDFYGAVNPDFEEQPANTPLTAGHDPGSEPEPPPPVEGSAPSSGSAPPPPPVP
jgi:RHS repeat-associated protein